METGTTTEGLIPEATLEHAADCLRTIAHPTRLRMLDLLQHGEFAVSEIAERCCISQSHASSHLRLMQAHGLVERQQKGKAAIYRIAGPEVPGIMNCIRKTCGIKRIQE
jgi:DNA-binding transcriptional ArsR family regulator